MTQKIVENPAPAIVGSIMGVQIFNQAGTAAQVLTETIKTGGYAAGICTTIQVGLNGVKYIRGDSNFKQFRNKSISNCVGKCFFL